MLAWNNTHQKEKPINYSDKKKLGEKMLKSDLPFQEHNSEKKPPKIALVKIAKHSYVAYIVDCR